MPEDALRPDFTIEFMELLLLSVEEEFKAADQELPRRRYLTHGQTAADCDQLTVSLIQMYRGSPGTPPSEPTNCSSPTSVVVEVEILRKVPNGLPKDVSPEKLTASGRQHAHDMQLMLSSLCRMVAPRYFWSGALFADVIAGETQGDYAGPKMTVTAQVG